MKEIIFTLSKSYFIKQIDNNKFYLIIDKVLLIQGNRTITEQVLIITNEYPLKAVYDGIEYDDYYLLTFIAI